MTRYIAVIEHSEGVFGAFVPDCPGCTAMGMDGDEAVHNVTEALREWMADRTAEGLAPPRVRSIEEIRLTDLDPAATIRDVLFASIPLLLDEGRLVRANISLDAGVLKTIDTEAKLRGLTRSAFLTSAAREKIEAGR